MPLKINVGLNNLQYIFYIAYACALVPIFDIQYMNKNFSSVHRYYSLSLAFVVFIIHLFDMYIITFIYLIGELTTTKILIVLQYGFITMSLLLTILISVFKRNVWRNLVLSFNDFDCSLMYISKQNLLLTGIIASIEISLIFFVVFNLIYRVMGVELYMNLILISEKIKMCVVSIPLLFICFVSNALKERFEFLNDTLENICKKRRRTFVINKNDGNADSFEIIKMIQSKYNSLGRIMMLFNSIFGWQILLLFVVVFLSLLHYIHNTIVYSGEEFHSELFLASMMLTALVLVCYFDF